MRKKSASNNAKPQSNRKKVSSPNQRERGRQVKSPPSMDPRTFLSSVSGSRSKRGRKIFSSPVPIASDVPPVSSPEDPSTIVDLRDLLASRTDSLKRNLDQSMRKKSSSNSAKPQANGKEGSPLNDLSSNQRRRQVKSPPSVDPLALFSSVAGSGSKTERKVLSPLASSASDASPVSSSKNPKMRKKFALKKPSLSPHNARGRQVKSPPSKDPLAFFAALSGSGLRRGSKILSSPPPVALDASPVSSPKKNPSTIADLKNLVASRTESLKRHVDLCHSDVMKEIDASQTRISKRFRAQTQACLQLTEEIDNEYKKMSDRIVENTELFKGSYKEFIEEAQSAAARLCKESFSELAKSTEKALNDLRARYNIPIAPI